MIGEPEHNSGKIENQQQMALFKSYRGSFHRKLEPYRGKLNGGENARRDSLSGRFERLIALQAQIEQGLANGGGESFGNLINEFHKESAEFLIDLQKPEQNEAS